MVVGEAKAVASITANKVMKFIWNIVITYFEIPWAMIF